MTTEVMLAFVALASEWVVREEAVMEVRSAHRQMVEQGLMSGH